MTKGKLSKIMSEMPSEDREATLEALADPNLTGGQIATTLNRQGYPATRSQVNHWRRRARQERLLKEANEPQG